MTITEITLPTPAPSATPLEAVTFDLYRDVHKAIRVELFTLTARAGRTDPTDDDARAELARRVRAAVELLDMHAHHEDDAIDPHLQAQLPDLAEQVQMTTTPSRGGARRSSTWPRARRTRRPTSGDGSATGSTSTSPPSRAATWPTRTWRNE